MKSWPVIRNRREHRTGKRGVEFSGPWTGAMGGGVKWVLHFMGQ